MTYARRRVSDTLRRSERDETTSLLTWSRKRCITDTSYKRKSPKMNTCTVEHPFPFDHGNQYAPAASATQYGPPELKHGMLGDVSYTVPLHCYEIDSHFRVAYEQEIQVE